MVISLAELRFTFDWVVPVIAFSQVEGATRQAQWVVVQD
jgi:hypothetical protein